MFDHVTANNQIKVIFGKRIGKHAEIVNDVCIGAGIRIDTDGAGILVLPAANIKNLLRSVKWLHQIQPYVQTLARQQHDGACKSMDEDSAQRRRRAAALK